MKLKLLALFILIAFGASAQTTPWSTSPATVQTRMFSGIFKIRWLVGNHLYSPLDSISGGGGGTTTYPLTVNNSGAGDASSFIFNGAAARILSWNSIGALPTTLTANTTISTSTFTFFINSGSGADIFMQPGVVNIQANAYNAIQFSASGNSTYLTGGTASILSTLQLNTTQATLSYVGTGGTNSLQLTATSNLFTDGTNGRGIQYPSNYTTNQRLQRLSIPSVNTVIALADSVKATISGGTGTMTSITPGVGFSSHTPITVSGTMDIDTSATIVSKTFAGRYVKTNTAASLASLSLSGTAGAGLIDLIAQSSDPATPATGHNIIFADASGRFSVKGSNGFDWTVSKSLLTATRVQLVPDSAGTYALESRIIPNASLQNPSITIQGASTPLGGSVNPINGTGFVKATGTTISYDNSTYITGNQTITFTPTGDVTGSTTGTTSLTPALSIGAGKVVNSMIATGTIDLVAKVTGILPVANGGTNLSTYTTGDLPYASATNVLSKLAIGATGNPLIVIGGVPAWSNLVLTNPASAATFTLAAGKTFTNNNTLTINSTDGITMTTPTTSFTAARTDAANTFTGIQTMANITNTSTYTLNRSGLTTGLSNAIQIYNTSAATVGSQVQNSPLIEFKAQGWNTTPTAANNVMLAGIVLEPVAGATVSSNLNMYFNDNAGGYTKRFGFSNTGNLSLSVVGGELKIAEGSGGFVGQTTLVSGTKAITIANVTTSSRAIVTLVSQGGTVTTTTAYAGVCTSNTVTITALTNAGSTDTTDTSILNYFIVN